MREVGRVAQGFYPTPPRVVDALARLIVPPSSGPYTVLDAGCGTAAAIVQLRERWTETHPAAQVRLFGIESDRHRAKESARNIAAHPAGGACLWAAIEDSKPDRDVSMLFFNPPYDRIRGNVRMELLLYDLVAEWVIRGGILAFVLPDYVLADEGTGLPRALDRQYECLGIWKFPEPEYQAFKQCVFIGRRRERALNRNRTGAPDYLRRASAWPVLPDNPKRLAELPEAEPNLVLHRVKLSPQVIVETVAVSPVRGALLREALLPPLQPERPAEPLREGHIALAMAGIDFDEAIEKDGEVFLPKASITTQVRKVKETDKVNDEGKKIATIETHRTHYDLNVRCLRPDGEIETYTSKVADEQPAAKPVDGEESEAA